MLTINVNEIFTLKISDLVVDHPVISVLKSLMVVFRHSQILVKVRDCGLRKTQL